MYKKKTLLLLTTTSLASVAMSIVAVGQNLDVLASEKARANGTEYSLSVTTEAINKSINGFDITNARGTNFYFSVNPNPKPQMKGEDYVVRYYGNQWGVTTPVALIKCDGNAVDSTHPVNGIESITVNYSGKVGTGSDPSRPDTELTIKYGFVQDDYCNFVYEETLPSSGTAFTFHDLLPNCFAIECDNGGSETWYEAKIESFTINYSCSESDAIKDAWLNDYFASTPKNIVRDGEDKIVSFESGAYPQTKASSTASTYLEANYSSLTPIVNDYYFYEGLLYARKQSVGTGYDNEYVESSYYWFEVNPVIWEVVSNNDSEYLVKAQSVLEDCVQFHNTTPQLTYYQFSTLCTFVNNMYSKMFRNDSIIQAQSSNELGGAKLYPLSSTAYKSGSSTSIVYSDAIAYTSDFARTGKTCVSLASSYWTISHNYQNSKNYAYYVQYDNGVTYSVLANLKEGVRPGMRIVIE